MRQTWRWFGPKDTVAVDAMLQAGVEGVVSALHHTPTGAVWTPDEIAKRQDEISRMKNGAPSGLRWEVVESLPVSEDIKKQQGDWRTHYENYKTSLANIAAAGIEVVCYNFMPVLDWTRTSLRWPRPSGAVCMRFDFADFAAFDIFILKRKGAESDYPAETAEEAKARYEAMDDAAKQKLAKNVVFGLPGAAENFTMDDVRQHLAEYDSVSVDRLRSNFIDFLTEVAPAAEKLGVRLCCHPDDPPFDLLGLPRIMSTESDYKKILDAVDTPANGMTLCTGSLGARPDNDLPGMINRLGDRLHFLHLRNVKRDTKEIRGSFYEAEHLGGDNDMVAIIAAALREEKRRKAAGRADCSIPIRPDHGQDILDDLEKNTQPGYPAIGRLRGLAEVRGIMQALSHAEAGSVV
ncbi:MAG: mannonate dehydratase [Rhodospirillales bacterium]